MTIPNYFLHSIHNNTMAGSAKNVMQYGMLTDYSENCSLNEYLRDRYKIGPDATNMRLFLQRNGNRVRADMLKKAEYISVTGSQCYSGFPPQNEEWVKPSTASNGARMNQYQRGTPIPDAHAQNVWSVQSPMRTPNAAAAQFQATR